MFLKLSFDICLLYSEAILLGSLITNLTVKTRNMKTLQYVSRQDRLSETSKLDIDVHGIVTRILNSLTNWSRVTHICARKLTIIGSDNGLAPDHHQVITWTNAGMCQLDSWEQTSGQSCSEFIHFSFKKMHLKLSSGKWQPFCLGQNVLK